MVVPQRVHQLLVRFFPPASSVPPGSAAACNTSVPCPLGVSPSFVRRSRLRLRRKNVRAARRTATILLSPSRTLARCRRELPSLSHLCRQCDDLQYHGYSSSVLRQEASALYTTSLTTLKWTYTMELITQMITNESNHAVDK